MKKTTIMTYGVLGIVLCILGITCILQSSKIRQLEETLAAKSTEIMTVSTSGVENEERLSGSDVQVRLFYGQVQYKVEDVWQSACSLEELNASDPLVQGLATMQSIIAEKQAERSAEQASETEAAPEDGQPTTPAILARETGVILKKRPVTNTQKENPTTEEPTTASQDAATPPSTQSGTTNSGGGQPSTPAAPTQPTTPVTPTPPPSTGNDGEDIGWTDDVL